MWYSTHKPGLTAVLCLQTVFLPSTHSLLGAHQLSTALCLLEPVPDRAGLPTAPSTFSSEQTRVSVKHPISPSRGQLKGPGGGKCGIQVSSLRQSLGLRGSPYTTSCLDGREERLSTWPGTRPGRAARVNDLSSQWKRLMPPGFHRVHIQLAPVLHFVIMFAAYSPHHFSSFQAPC